MLVDILIQALASFLTSAGFAVFFNSKRRTIIPAGLTGMVGWLVHYLSVVNFGSANFMDFLSYVLSGLVMGFMAQYFSTKLIASPVVFYISGIIPHVPGGAAYRIFYSLFYGDMTGVFDNLQAIVLTASALALGILIALLTVEQYWPQRSGYNIQMNGEHETGPDGESKVY